MKRRLLLICGAMVLYLLSGFIVKTAGGSVSGFVLPTLVGPFTDPAAGQAVPTVAGVFSEQVHPEQGQPSPAPTATPRSASPSPTPPAATPTPVWEVAVTVYDERLNPDWTILDGTGVDVNLASRPVVKDGRVALAMTPVKDFASLFFAVKPQPSGVFPRSRVTGLKFWLNSGEDVLTLGSLAVTVVGSNSIPYWAVNDNSVTSTANPVFSETRLYYLGINRDIPARTWVEVELWLDELVYDPEYRYVTGFYLKSDEGFRRTIYIDNVRLIMLESE